MARFGKIGLAIAVCLIAAPIAKADLLSISDGQSSFNYDPDASGGVSLIGPVHGDVLAGLDWAFRYFDPSESAVRSRTLASIGSANVGGAFIHNDSTANGDTGSTDVNIDWVEEGLPTNIVNELFDIRFEYTISTGASDTPVLDYTVTVTNVSGSTQNNLSLMNYADYDINGFGGDAGEFEQLLGRDGFQQVDVATSVSMYHAFDDYDRAQIKAWAAGDNLIDRFLGGGDLDGSGSPFGPGDMTGGFQWDFSLANGESFQINGYIGVPEPGTVGLTTTVAIVAGIGALYRRRKRNRVNEEA